MAFPPGLEGEQAQSPSVHLILPITASMPGPVLPPSRPSEVLARLPPAHQVTQACPQLDYRFVMINFCLSTRLSYSTQMFDRMLF